MINQDTEQIKAVLPKIVLGMHTFVVPLFFKKPDNQLVSIKRKQNVLDDCQFGIFKDNFNTIIFLMKLWFSCCYYKINSLYKTLYKYFDNNFKNFFFVTYGITYWYYKSIVHV